MEHRYTVIYEPAEEGGYVVHVPALNNLATQGENLEEAKIMATDAIRGYIETLKELNQPIPEDIFIAKETELNFGSLAVGLSS